MSDIGTDTTPQVVDRKELLAQQFDDVETAAKVETPAVTPAPGSEGRARDGAGKFVAKDLAAPNLAQQQGERIQPQAAPVVTPVEPPAWDKAPASWKKEKHPLWAGMTPEQREYAYQREEQMRSGVEPLLPKAELADKINKAAEPYMNTIRGLGIDLPAAVGGLMKVDHDLRTLPYEQKLQTLVQVARSYGIDLTGQAQAAQPSFDPNFQAMQNELLNIKGQFTSFTQAQEAAQQRSAMEEIQRFSQGKEHFEEVKPMMAQLLQGGLADNIQDAYDKALRLNPELFDAMNAAKQAASDAEKRKAADDAAKRAKAAAVSVKSATPGAKTTTNAQDRRSMLAEQIGGLSDRL